MEYELIIDGESFKGSTIEMLGSALNGIKDYIIPAFRELVKGEKYTEKWNMARKFLSEYLSLIVFMKKKLGKELHPAINDLIKACKMEGEEILTYLDSCKNPAIVSISRQIKGKVDSQDILDMFLDDVKEEGEDDDWED